jgi:hypothetical protein
VENVLEPWFIFCQIDNISRFSKMLCIFTLDFLPLLKCFSSFLTGWFLFFNFLVRLGFELRALDALPLESQLQFLLLWLIWRWDLYMSVCPSWPQITVLLISASQVARITDVSHRCWQSFMGDETAGFCSFLPSSRFHSGQSVDSEGKLEED